MASSSAGSLQCLLFFFLCKHCPFLSFIVLEGIHYFSSILALTFLKNINLLILIVGLLLYNIVLVLPSIPLGHPSAPALSTLYHASNLDWWFVSHMIIYIFQCHSPKPSHPRPLPQSPKDCSKHLCLFCCLAYRIVITIFLNSTYMHFFCFIFLFFNINLF